jgi:protein-disulfide isomerase
MNQQHAVELAIAVQNTDHVIGASQAPVTIVEYGDFECPNCKQAAPAVKLLLERFAARTRAVFRHYPLEDVHPHALAAAQAAECAGAQGQFWPMHDLLFANQEHLKVKQLHSYAERLGLDMARYTAEMNDEVYLQRIREHLEGGAAAVCGLRRPFSSTANCRTFPSGCGHCSMPLRRLCTTTGRRD